MPSAAIGRRAGKRLVRQGEAGMTADEDEDGRAAVKEATPAADDKEAGPAANEEAEYS